MVQRCDAVRHVERRVGERQVLAVGLHAPEVAVERAAAEADVRVDEDVGRDDTRSRARARSAQPTPSPRRPRARAARSRSRRSGRGAPGTSGRSRASSGRSSRARGSRTGERRRRCRRARTSPRPRLLEPALGLAELLAAPRAAPRGASAGCRRPSARTSGRSRCSASPSPPRPSSAGRTGSGGARAAASSRRGRNLLRHRGAAPSTHVPYSGSLRWIACYQPHETRGRGALRRDGRRGRTRRIPGQPAHDLGAAPHPGGAPRRRGPAGRSLAHPLDAAPRRQRLPRRASSSPSGIALAAGAIPATRELGGILGGCAILYVAGLVDDVFRLPPLAKIAGAARGGRARPRAGHSRRDRRRTTSSPRRSASSGSSG